MRKLTAYILAYLISTALYAGVPQHEITVDTQLPNEQWEIKYIYQGATPLIRYNLNVNGTNWYPSSDWSGFMWYGTNTDWSSTSIVRITGTFATNLYYVDCQATNSSFSSNGLFYGGLVMSNTTQLIEWGRGRIYVTSSGGIGGINSLSFTNGAYYNHITATGTVHGINLSTLMTNIIDAGTSGETGSVAITNKAGYIHFPSPTNSLTAWVLAYAYPSDNPDSYVTASVTNAHAQLNGTSAHGLGTMSTADASDYSASNQQATVTANAITTATNATTASTLAYAYPSNNPNGFVDATVTNSHAQLNGVNAHGLGTMSTETASQYPKLASSNIFTGESNTFAYAGGAVVRIKGSSGGYASIYDYTGFDGFTLGGVEWYYTGHLDLSIADDEIVWGAGMTNAIKGMITNNGSATLSGLSMTGNLGLGGNSATGALSFAFGNTSGATNMTFKPVYFTLNTTNYYGMEYTVYTNASNISTTRYPVVAIP